MKKIKYGIKTNHDQSNNNITNENEGLNKVNLISKEILESQEFRIMKLTIFLDKILGHPEALVTDLKKMSKLRGFIG